jgi:hypothetical protein
MYPVVQKVGALGDTALLAPFVILDGPASVGSFRRKES